jgi:uncharacterized protein
VDAFDVAELGLPDGICLLAYRGSIAHNMYVPGSDPNSIDDVDLMGVAIGTPEHYFGLREWGSRGTREIKRGKWDCVVYEIRKIVALLLQGNPNVMGLLWTKPEHILQCDDAGGALIANRRVFAGKHVYDAFAGYAHDQLEKMTSRDPDELAEYLAITAELKHRGAHPNHAGEKFEAPDRSSGVSRDVADWPTEKLLTRLRRYQKKGDNIGYMGEKRKRLVLEHGYDAKNAAHLIRLLRMCVEFLGTGELTVYREADREELLSIKRGGWALAEVKALASELFAEALAARDASRLPEGPDREAAERLLVDLVRRRVLAAG